MWFRQKFCPGPPPPEWLQRPFGPNTLCTYDIQFGLMWKEETKVGGLRTAVASALLVCCRVAGVGVILLRAGGDRYTGGHTKAVMPFYKR